MVVLILIFALALPLLLIPVEQVWPYPYVIEELAKLSLVWALVKSRKKTNHLVKWVVVVGLVFTFSESMFYLMNIFAVWDLGLWPVRLLLTGLLHVLTLLMLYWGVKKGRFWLLVTLAGAMLVHFLFNSQVAVLF